MVGLQLNSLLKMKPIPSQKVGFEFDPARKKFIIWFGINATKSDVLNEWEKFNKAREIVTGKKHYKKDKLPKDLALLGVVQFLRKKNLTFKQIHDVFANEENPYYDDSYHFPTEFELQKYYNRNKKYLKTKK